MMQTLDNQERIIFALRSLYDKYGYRQYKMSKFEEYDLYARNKDFLISDSVITFTDLGGKLMALKPDVTLSIVKNTTDTDLSVQKLYYNENVYRVSKGSHGFREIMQVGLECLGDIDDYCICEVLLLAAKSLQAISSHCILDISHLGLLTELLDTVGIPAELQATAFKAISEKNAHELESLCKSTGVTEKNTARLQALLKISGSIRQALPGIRSLLQDMDSIPSLARFCQILAPLEDSDIADMLQIDFSVVDDVHYYNGIVFKGFISGVPSSVLSGGQYDRLMKKMHRSCGAIGFAVYTDLLERLGNPRQYDVDTVLLYGKGISAQCIARKMAELTETGTSVLALSQLPETLRYRQLLRLEVNDLADNA